MKQCTGQVQKLTKESSEMKEELEAARKVDTNKIYITWDSHKTFS